MPNDTSYYDHSFSKYSYDQISQFPSTGQGLARYLSLLPIQQLRYSLGEGSTPLTPAQRLGKKYGLSQLYIKHEELNPTGCFKDRESAVTLSYAAEQGVSEVYVASSGNAALSTAAYAQVAGISCTCYIPEKTTPAKKDLIKLFGAELVEIPGNYEQVYRHTFDLERPGINVTPGACQVRIEGNKTIAYEIWETLGRVPDVVVVPAGNGGNLAGVWRGFWELQKLGLSTKVPKMIAVQVKNAAPLKQALADNKPFSILKDVPDSIAEGIIAEESYCSPKALEAIKATQGTVIEVTETEITTALSQVLKSESLVAEPTAAAAFAALPQLAKEVDPQATVVVINTGSGMKHLSEIVSLVA